MRLRPGIDRPFVSQVVSSVDESDGDRAALNIANLDSEVARRAESSAPLAESAARYLSGALPSLQAATVDLASVGSGFVAFARFLWHLYVPNLPLDPAVGLRAHSTFIGRQLAAMSGVLSAVRLDEIVVTGNTRNAKLDRVQQEVDVLRRQLEQAGVAPVTREGNTALLSALFAELRSFQEQIVSDTQLDGLVAELGKSWSPAASNRESNLQRSVDTLLRRLDHAYAESTDIVAPIRLSLASFKIGFALLAHTAQAAAQPHSNAPFRTLVRRLTAFPSIAQRPAIHGDELPLSIKAGEAPLHPAQASLLQVAALTASIADETSSRGHAIVRLTQLYERMHFLWATDRHHDEEAAEAEASLYKAKLDVQQAQTDEELEAAEFAKLFPTFSDVMADEDDEAPAAAAADAPSKPSRLIQPGDQTLLAQLHTSLFAEKPASVGSAASAAYDRLRQSGVDTLVPKLYESLDEALDRDSAAYRVRALVALSQAANPPESVEAPHHDFYNEPNVRETAKVVPVLLDFVARLEVIIAKWPEQMVLHALRDRCRAILNLTSSASIALVLTNLEQLLQHTEDWEKFADREHSISANRNALIALIVEWRRLELTCWSRLLSTVQDTFGETVSTWFFRFYETCIRSAPGLDREAAAAADPEADPDEFFRDLVKLLDSFFQSCSIGQFGARLDLVLAFANYASQLGSRPDAVKVRLWSLAVSRSRCHLLTRLTLCRSLGTVLRRSSVSATSSSTSTPSTRSSSRASRRTSSASALASTRTCRTSSSSRAGRTSTSLPSERAPFAATTSCTSASASCEPCSRSRRPTSSPPASSTRPSSPRRAFRSPFSALSSARPDESASCFAGPPRRRSPSSQPTASPPFLRASRPRATRSTSSSSSRRPPVSARSRRRRSRRLLAPSTVPTSTALPSRSSRRPRSSARSLSALRKVASSASRTSSSASGAPGATCSTSSSAWVSRRRLRPRLSLASKTPAPCTA